MILAGDAAHLTPPFAGQGMNSGVRDANNLAWKLAAVVQGQLGPKLMASYEPERRDHAWSMIEFALAIGRVMRPPNALAAFALEYGFLLLSRFPKARDYIAQMKFKPPPRFAHGFLVPDAAGAKKTLVGRMMPQPRVLDRRTCARCCSTRSWAPALPCWCTATGRRRRCRRYRPAPGPLSCRIAW